MADEQGVIPMLAYEDGVAALEWLCAAFGFTELDRVVEGDRLTHAAIDTGRGVVMLASPSPDYESPARHRTTCGAAARWSAVPWVVDGVLVHVDDVTTHHARAQAAGARVLSPPEDGWPGRRYRVEDVEGHRWMFLERTP